MKISMNWISDYVDISNIDVSKLALSFTMSTAEIEEVTYMGKEINNVVVGQILTCEEIPESKKLHKLTVDTGSEVVQCMCGAPNARVGIKIPFAKVGGSVIGMKIGAAKLAGYDSFGMCCSGKEIGFSDDHSGLLEFEDSVVVGTDVKELLQLEDVIWEVDNKSITNRPDLWGHYGIAREIAAITGRKLKEMPVSDLEQYKDLPKIPVEIQDDRCRRYACMVLDNVKRPESPYYMQTRLFYCGMRAISFLVDLTNYIMLDVGQPMHAFEREGIEKIVVRASRGEKFTTLDNVEREVGNETLFICNNDKPIALAGIMGGLDSEVTEKTKSIILESANFDAGMIRRNAAKLGMRTEASARYEKTLDSEYVIDALKRFVYLLMENDEGATVSGGLSDTIKKPQEEVTIQITKSYIDSYIGEALPLEKIVSILESLKFEVKVNGEELTIKVPTFRASKDVGIKADIVEEVARIYGFDNIIPAPTKVSLEPLRMNFDRETEYKVKSMLAENFGLSEVHSYIWYDNKFNQEVGIGNLEGIKVLSPSAPELADIRQCMAPTLLNFANENKKNYDAFGIFDIGSVASVVNGEVEEHKELGVLLASKSEGENDLFYRLKGMINHILRVTKNVELTYLPITEKKDWMNPVKTAKIVYNDVELGYLSVIHPKIKNNIDKKLNVAVLELNMFKLYEIEGKELSFGGASKYPEVSFDLSLLIDKTLPYATVKKDLNNFESAIIIRNEFVDLYEGVGLPEDKKSMTFTFVWGAKDHTLTGEEVEAEKVKLLEYLNSKGYTSRY
ncbi:MAG: phenylalanine--tRNA ligase subunit beta [Clostridia bacterium]|nr:phenylalanine--tRNA ligase subunit beta [Clostridia bacterium]